MNRSENGEYDKKGNKLSKRIIAGTLAVSAGAFALAGCATEEVGAAPSPTSSTSETATPKPTKTESTPEPVETEAVIPESLEKYEQMSVEEFAQLEWSEQLNYWPWLSRDIEAFAKEYVGAQSDLDKNLKVGLPYGSPSVDNTAQDALTYGGYAERLIFSLEGDDAWKALYIVSPDHADRAIGSDHFTALKDALETVQSTGRGILEAWQQGATDTFPISTVVGEEGRWTTEDGIHQMSVKGESFDKDGNPRESTGIITLGTYFNPLTQKEESWWF